MATPDAFDIAARFLDSGKARNDLELAILQHMEQHIAIEREACAKVALAENSFMMLQDFGMQSMCTQVRENVAAAIRARGKQGDIP